MRRRIACLAVRHALVALAAFAGIAPSTRPAAAIEVELLDVAPDRVERQRAYGRGATPLPATPDLDKLDERLAAKGLKLGNRIFIRIFKASSQLEIWMQRSSDKTFVLLDTYPVCHWTGTLGPKLKEGDKQSPEGFYTVRWQQTRLVGRWRKAFNLGFPNAFDQLNKRTGSYILIHGGCSSVGCFAMTEQVQDEIHRLTQAAFAGGQKRFHVHAFPFRMTEENLARHADSPWIGFWRDLKSGYDAFERTRLPPRIGLCEQRYVTGEGAPADDGNPDAFTILKPDAAAPALTAHGAYQPPRCVMDPPAERPIREVVATAAGAEPGQPAPVAQSQTPMRAKPRSRVAVTADDDDEQPRVRRRPRPASAADRPSRRPSDGRPATPSAPGRPSYVASGG